MELRILERTDWSKEPNEHEEWPKIQVLQYRPNSTYEWEDVPLVKI